MKNYLLLLTTLLFFGVGVSAQSLHDRQSRGAPDWFKKGITYQISARQMSEEGTLKGAEAHLERLRDLGIDIIYLCPVNVADTDMDQTYWSPRQIKSGFNDPRNPYRAGDYFHVDPEYGNDQDLKDFIDHAHALGIRVMLDLVFFHCGPGAQVVKQHPEFFKYDKDGKFYRGEWSFPVFDYSRKDVREYMKTVMQYYIADFNVDGFRLDVGDLIPLDFWEDARKAIDIMKPDLVMVGEASDPTYTLYAWNANYGREICYPMINYLKKSVSDMEACDASSIRKAHEKQINACPKNMLFWNFLENHDIALDSYNDRFEKVLGYERCTLGLAFSFAIDGVPLIYNGSDVCYDKLCSIFGHKGSWVNWKEYIDTPHARERMANIRSWAAMRKANSALTHGETVWIDNDQPKAVISFKRHDGVSPDVVFVGNFSDKKVKVRLADGTKYKINPWGFVFTEAK